MAEAPYQMIVHHARRLHEGVADGAAHKREAAFAQVLAHRIAFRRGGRALRGPAILERPPAREAPDVSVEAAELPLHREKRFRIRVGDYRIIYEIYDDRLLVLVVEMGHRREVYREME